MPFWSSVSLKRARAVGVVVPRHVDLDHLADAAPLNDLAGLGDVRHAPLLRADLHDALVIVLRRDDGRPFAQVVRQRLLDIDVLPGRTRIDGHRHVPVIRRRDDARH